MVRKIFLIVVLFFLIVAISLGTNKFMNDMGLISSARVKMIPIKNTTMVLQSGGRVIYVDPVGGAEVFKGLPAPDLILLTHNNPNHFDLKTLEAVSKKDTDIVAPVPMAYMFPDTVLGTLYVMKNGQKTIRQGIEIQAINVYGLSVSKGSYDKKIDGNGYVLDISGNTVNISIDAGTQNLVVN